MNLTVYTDYISASLAKGTLGANISVGIFALIGVFAVLGVYYGLMRGFSKSVVRIFTVAASAVCALICVMGISNIIVKTALGSGGEIETVEELLNKYFPGFVKGMPNVFKPLVAEMSAETATVFAMMVVAVLISPILLIAFFYLFKVLSMLIYELLSGLSGIISYGKGTVSTILGGVVGLAQGLLIAAVIIIPIRGVCGVAESAREPLIGERENPNAYLVQVYDIVDDVSDNPVFDLVDKFGGNTVFNKMITVKIADKKYNMGEECVDAVRILTDLLPLATPDFDWKNPTEEQKNALSTAIVDLGNDELIASLSADVMRGVARCIRGNYINLGLSGSSKVLMNDVMSVFATTTKDTVEGDMDLLIDIYIIICDRHLMDAYVNGNAESIRDALTNKDENGVSGIDLILERLNEYDRAEPIVTSFTKLSISNMMGSLGMDQTTEQLYEDVKGSVAPILEYNKSDFETEEEYRTAVSDSLNQAFIDNNLTVEESVKNSMVDYIAENYGDFEGEITDKEINDAILSYYKSYADNKDNLGTEENPEGDAPEADGGEEVTPEVGDLPDPEGGEEPQPEGGEEPQPEGGEEPQPEGGEEPQPEGGETPEE